MSGEQIRLQVLPKLVTQRQYAEYIRGVYDYVLYKFTFYTTSQTVFDTCSCCFDQPSSRDISSITRGSDSSAALTLRNANLVRRASTSTAVAAYSRTA